MTRSEGDVMDAALERAAEAVAHLQDMQGQWDSYDPRLGHVVDELRTAASLISAILKKNGDV